MIPVINTKTLIEEKTTEGHAPMLFLCEDGYKYYVKYLLVPHEYRFLLFELIGSILCEHHSIPTPDYSFIHIDPNSYNKKDLKENKKWLKADAIGFGSKEVPTSDLFTDLYIPQTKADYNQYINPTDLIKVALLDLWILNTDRKDGRYNFLFSNTQEGKKIYAIDHAFAFGGVKQKHLSVQCAIETADMLISSNALKAFTNCISTEVINGVIDEFYYLCNNNSKKKIEVLFEQLPAQWKIEKSYTDNIINFLYNSERLKKLRFTSLQLLLTNR